MPRATVALLTLAVALAVAPSAGAAPATYKGSSANGKIVFFETADQLVPGDTDSKRDVYERYFDSEPGVKSYVTREISLGPTGGNDAYNATFAGANEAGTKVFFTTEESLVEEDTDHHMDVYMREPETGRTVLVSRGAQACSPGCGNGSFDASFAGASADGNKVFFETQERLTASDTDNSVDIYERNLLTEETTLVSAGSASCLPECGNGPYGATLRGISPNGSDVYFTTEEALTPQDTDTTTDIYARELAGGGETQLVSQAAEGCSTCVNEDRVPIFQGSSEDGTRVFFSTDEKLVGADNDGATDIYARDLPNGPTFLISGGTEAKPATFAANSSDGKHVFFNTLEPLLPEDENGANDIYEWSSGGNLRLVTSAPCASNCGATFDAASADSETVIFSTAAQLSGEDHDNAVDIYSQPVAGGAPTLVSRGEEACAAACGNGEAGVHFNRASADAGQVIFTTPESLSPEDGDIENDIYSRNIASNEETSLITTSPSYCPLPRGNCGATFAGASPDGSHIFFTTLERFTLEDGDDEEDVYERELGATPAEDVTRLVSQGNSPDLELGPPTPKLEGTNPVSPAASTAPKVFGEAKEGSTVKLYANSSCSGEPVGHGSRAQFASPGIGVTVGVGETARFWATAEAEGFVSLCGGPIAYRQENVTPAEEGSSGGGGGSGSGGGGAAGGGKPKVGLPGGGERPAYVTPHTRITFAPAAKTRSRNPTLRFTDATGQRGTTFECKVDRHPWKHCRSPLRLRKLARGRHTVEIRAVNAVGTAEPRPAVRRFKVVPR